MAGPRSALGRDGTILPVLHTPPGMTLRPCSLQATRGWALGGLQAVSAERSPSPLLSCSPALEEDPPFVLPQLILVRSNPVPKAIPRIHTTLNPWDCLEVYLFHYYLTPFSLP